MYPMFPRTAIINEATGCGKTHFVMDLLQFGPYQDFFDIVIVLCPTFLDNDTYISRYKDTFEAKKIDNNHTHFYY